MTTDELNDLKARRDAAWEEVAKVNRQIDALLDTKQVLATAWVKLENEFHSEELKQKLRAEIASEAKQI
jgi:hypothetical protein